MLSEIGHYYLDSYIRNLPVICPSIPPLWGHYVVLLCNSGSYASLKQYHIVSLFDDCEGKVYNVRGVLSTLHAMIRGCNLCRTSINKKLYCSLAWFSQHICSRECSYPQNFSKGFQW
mgnify:CR=1 FL=1